MSQKKYILTIPEPCHEQWSQMTSCGAGKFCASCEKTVMDFTPLSDDSIVRILESSQGKICGRFQKNQLNRIVAQTETQPSYFSRMLKIAAGILLPTVLHPSIANAQGNITQQTMNVQQDSLTIHGAEIKSKDNAGNTIEGKVMDAYTDKALIGIKISIEGTQISTTTDSYGNFKVEVPDSLFQGNSVVVELSSNEYQTEYWRIFKNNLPVKKEVRMLPSVKSVEITNFVSGLIFREEEFPIKNQKYIVPEKKNKQ